MLPKKKEEETKNPHQTYRKKRSVLWLPEGWREGKLKECGQKIQSSSFKINQY